MTIRGGMTWYSVKSQLAGRLGTVSAVQKVGRGLYERKEYLRAGQGYVSLQLKGIRLLCVRDVLQKRGLLSSSLDHLRIKYFGSLRRAEVSAGAWSGSPELLARTDVIQRPSLKRDIPMAQKYAQHAYSHGTVVRFALCVPTHGSRSLCGGQDALGPAWLHMALTS